MRAPAPAPGLTAEASVRHEGGLLPRQPGAAPPQKGKEEKHDEEARRGVWERERERPVVYRYDMRYVNSIRGREG